MTTATRIAVTLTSLKRPPTWWPRRGLRRGIIAIAAVIAAVLVAVSLSGGPASNNAHHTPADPPDRPVREYFRALAARDFATAYSISRTAHLWLSGDGLARGYQPPSHLQVLDITYGSALGASRRPNPNLAYVRVRYQLADKPFESTLEVIRRSQSGKWWINSGSTGRLDVVSPLSQRVKIAALDVITPLRSARVSGGIASTGFFELPPGIYAVTLADNQSHCADAVEVAVPAMWRDGTPVTVPISSCPGHGQSVS